MRSHQKKRKRQHVHGNKHPSAEEDKDDRHHHELDRFAGSSEEDEPERERQDDAAARTKERASRIKAHEEEDGAGGRKTLVAHGRTKSNQQGPRILSKQTSFEVHEAAGEGDSEGSGSEPDRSQSSRADDSDAEDDEKIKPKSGSKRRKVKLGIFDAADKKLGGGENSGEVDDDSDSESALASDDDSLEDVQATASASGMANAMVRILGTDSAVGDARKKGHSRTSSGHPATSAAVPPATVVLSQTKTPLQKQAEQERQQERELKERRRQNREKHLQALHIPLSARGGTGEEAGAGTAIAKELEQERMLRKIATRGVVALFNAIAQHQKVGKEPITAPREGRPGGQSGNANIHGKKGSVAQMTKEGFLNLIKSKASQAKERVEAKTVHPPASTETPSRASSGNQKWDALRDDYMMDPKQNWDKQE
jgi:hypothetical protein